MAMLKCVNLSHFYYRDGANNLIFISSKSVVN